MNDTMSASSAPARLGKPATIVVCEDDTATLELLCDHLAADSFAALPVTGASDALRLCRYSKPDMLLLDLSLPDASGLDVLREIREADGVNARFDPKLPVIVLSGRGAEDERVRGLEAGADDYLIKPFHYPELRARINAVLRHRAARQDGLHRVGDLVIDPPRRRVWVKSETWPSATRSSRCCGCSRPTRSGSSPRRNCPHPSRPRRAAAAAGRA
jgi:DNA-binding response OmpR family regulator